MKHSIFLTTASCLIAVFTAMSLTLVSCKNDKNADPKDPSTEENGGNQNENPDPVTYTLTVLSNDEEMGTVTGGGTYAIGAEATLTATPNVGYCFVRWNDDNTDNPRKLSVMSNLEITAIFDYAVSGVENNLEYVDLGLPSGLKWATCNVGASAPEEYGNYYSWGETETKTDYQESTYTYTESPSVLPLDKDAAAVNMGGAWRMPTDAEWLELKDNCTWTWEMSNDKGGYRITSKTNGYSIYLPAAGGYFNTLLYGTGTYGAYCSSSLNTDNPSTAYGIFFDSANINIIPGARNFGVAVRGVFEE